MTNNPNSISLQNDFKPIRDSIDKLIGSLSKLETRLESVQKDVSVFDKLFGSTPQFKEFVNTVNTLNSVSGEAFGVLANGLSQLGNAFKTFPQDFKTGGLNRFTKAVLLFFQQIQSLNINFAKDQIESLKALAGTLNSLSRLSGANLKGFAIDQTTLDSMQHLVQTISGIPNDANKKAGLLGAIGTSVKTFFELNVGTTGTRNAALFSNSLLSFSRALKNLNATVDNVDVTKIIKVFTKLAIPLQLVSVLLRSLPGFNEINEFSKIFQRLGIGLAGISRAANGLDNESIARFVKALLILGGAIKVISQIVRFKGDQNSEAFSKVISSVVGALVQLNRLSTVKNQSNLAVSLQAQVRFLVNLIGAFRKLKGAQIPDIGNTIRAITDSFKLFNQEFQVDQKAIGIFERFVDKFINSISKLSKINIDPSRLAAFNVQIGQLGNASKTESLLASIDKSLKFESFMRGITNAIGGVNKLIGAIKQFPNAVAESFKAAGLQLDNLGNTLITKGRQVLQAFSLKSLTEAGGFDIAANFQDLSKQLEIFGNLTSSQLKDAQAFADQIGIKYPLSANDALQATLDLIKAGQDLGSTFEILPAAADLASLSDTKDIKATTAALIAAEGAFDNFSTGIEGSFDNINVAADILSAGADASSASIESLSEGLGDAGVAANQAGLSFEDTVAALAILDKATLKGAEGGRGLRSALNSIFTRDQAAAEFKKLGVAIFDASGNVRDFDSILKDLRKKFDGFTQQQIINSLGNIADTFGRTSLSVLIMNNGLSDTIDAMGKTGTAAEKAAKILDTFKGDAEQLKGSLETLMKDIFLPMIERAFRPFVQILRQATDFLLKLPQPVKEAASTFILLASSIATLVGGVSIAIGIFAKLSGAFLTIAGNAITLIFNIQKLAIVIAGFGTSLLVVLPAIVAITGGLALLSEAVSSAFRQIQDNVGGAGIAFDGLRKRIEQTFGEITRIITTFAQTIQFGFNELFGQTDTERGSALAHTISTISVALQGFINTLKKIDTDTIVATFVRIKLSVEDFINNFLETFHLVRTGVGDFIGPIREAVNQLLPAIGSLVQSFASLFHPIVESTDRNEVADTLIGIIKFIRTVIIDQITSITNIVRFFNDNILQPLLKAVPKIIDGVERFVGVVVKALAPLADFVSHGGERILSFFKTLPDLLTNIRSIDIGSILGGVGQKVLSVIQSIPQAISRVLQSVGISIGSSLLFFIGKGLQTGDFSELISQIGITITNFIKSIPDFISNIGSSLGDEFIFNFGRALKEGDVNLILNTFFDLVEHLVLEGFRRISEFIGNSVRFVIRTLFTQVGEETETTFLSTILGLLDNLTAPIQFALRALSRVLDVGQVGLEIAASFVRSFARAVLDLIPNAISVIAASFEEGTTKQLLLGFANAVKTIVASLTNILAFPLKFIGSAFNALSAFLDLLDKIGLTRGPVLGVILLLTAHLTGLTAAIVKFSKAATLKVLQPTIDSLKSLFSNLNNFAKNALNQVSTALTNLGDRIKFFFNSIRTGNPLRDVDALDRGFNKINFSLKDLAKSGFSTITSGLSSIARGFRSIVAAAAPLLSTISLVTSLKGILDALAGSAEGLPFLRTFIQSVGDSLLALVGLDRLIPRFHEGLDILQGIFETFANLLGQKITQIFLQTVNGFNDLRARVEQAISDLGGPQSAFAKQFFEVGDTLKAAGEKSGIEFFNSLINNMLQGDPEALRAQLLPFRDTLIKEFSSMFSDSGNFNGPAEDLNRIANFLAFSDALPEAFKIMEKNANQLSSFFFTSLTQEQQDESFASFFNSLIRAGIENVDLPPALLRDQILAQLDAGNIDSDQAAKFLDSIGFSADAISATAGELVDRFAVLSQSINDVFAATRQNTLDDLNQQLKDGKISADEYQAALSQFGSTITESIDTIRTDKIEALSKQFDEGAINEEEFRAQFEAINKEADNSTVSALKDEITRVSEAAQNGAIPMEEAAKQIGVLNEKIGEIQNSSSEVRDLRAELLKLGEDFITGAVDATRFATEFARITKAIEDAKAAAGTAPSGGAGGLTSFFSKLFDTINQRSGAGGAEDQAKINEELKGELELREKIADFERNERRKAEDDALEEKKKQDDISKIKLDAEQKEKDDLAKFQLDKERQEKDHQEKLLDIARSANDQFNDAIASRDSSAAQAAQKSASDQTRQENAQFKKDQERGQQDFDLQVAQNARERDERVRAAEQELQDLITKNAVERQRRQEDEAIEEQRLRDKNATALTEQASADQAQETAQENHRTKMQDSFLSLITNIETATSQGLPGIAGLFTSFFTNTVNQLAQIAGIPLAQQAAVQGNSPAGATLPPPRGKGGSVKAGHPYEVGDTKDFEVLDMAGRKILIPPRNGQITPIPSKRNNSFAGGSSMSVSIGDIIVTGVAGSPIEIASAIEKKIVERFGAALKDQAVKKRAI